MGNSLKKVKGNAKYKFQENVFMYCIVLLLLFFYLFENFNVVFLDLC